MSNRDEHVAAGVAVGGLLGLVQVATRGGSAHECAAGAFGGALGGLLGGRAPDLLEPPDHPHHRGAMHSWAFATAGSAAAAKVASPWTDFWEAQRAGRTASECLVLAAFEGFGPGAVGGYASHLALDAGTPMGLPLLGVR